MPSIEVTGARAFYAERGAGPALLCVHGAGGLHSHWSPVLAGLAEGCRVIAPDLPGHGRSAGPGRTSISAYATWLGELLDALGVEQTLLCGHSLGAAAALELALARPERVVGLILIGASARLRVTPALIDGFESDPAAAVELLVSLLYAADAEPALREAGRAEYLRCDPQVFRNDFAACDGWDVRPRLAGLRRPALVLCGSEDRLTAPKFAQELHSLLAGSALAWIAGAGHVPMIEQPAQTLTAIAQWRATAVGQNV